METTVAHQDRAGQQGPTDTLTGRAGATLRALLSNRAAHEDTGYAPRRLSSPTLWDRLGALWELISRRSNRREGNSGYGFEQIERIRMQLPSLVEAGRHAGRSRVLFRGSNINLHLWLRDSFISIVQNKTRVLILAFFIIYQILFWLWGSLYYILVVYKPGCLYGADSYVEAWVFAVITQMTIGYGNTGPQNCWPASVMIVIQGIFSVLLGSVVVGIMFARISHPHYRGRSIYMSDRAVVARRDGTLKLMFRIADIRRTQVVEPHVKTFLYTWGSGRVTAEGERIPVRCEALDIGYIDGMMLLPLVVEHTIDERSPLCGHTHDSLTGLSAEIVVTFEGTTEFGNPFMARRSYLPHEIHWGEQFLPIVMQPDVTAADKHFGVDLTHFHQLRRQKDVAPGPPSETSHSVVTRALKTVPYPLLGENTLVVSDCLCVSWAGNGKLELSARVGDTYPNQMIEVVVHFILYRWCRLEDQAMDPLLPTFEQHRLEVGYITGADRLNLRLPLEVKHIIDADSPLASWLQPDGVDRDLNSEIVVVLNGYRTRSADNILRQRTYIVGHHVRWGHRFVSIVRPPGFVSDGKARVRWGRFHGVAVDTRTDAGGNLVSVPGGPRTRLTKAAARQAITSTDGMVRAPESHAPRRAQAAHAEGSEEQLRINESISNMLTSMPSTLGSMGAEASDYTVIPMDLHRYAAEIASMSLLPARSRRPGLPRFGSIGPSSAGDGAGGLGRFSPPAGAAGFPLSASATSSRQASLARADSRGRVQVGRAVPGLVRTSPFASSPAGEGYPPTAPLPGPSPAGATPPRLSRPPGIPSPPPQAGPVPRHLRTRSGEGASSPSPLGPGAGGSGSWAPRLRLDASPEAAPYSPEEPQFQLDVEGAGAPSPKHLSPVEAVWPSSPVASRGGQHHPAPGSHPPPSSTRPPLSGASSMLVGSLDAVPEERAMQDAELSLDAPLVLQRESRGQGSDAQDGETLGGAQDGEADGAEGDAAQLPLNLR